VTDVLDLLAAGLSPAEVLEELPDLEPEDSRFPTLRTENPLRLS